MAQPNQLNPRVQRIGIGTGGSSTHGLFITAGAGTDSANIIAEIGTPGTDCEYGTIYICNTTGTVFIAIGTSFSNLAAMT